MNKANLATLALITILRTMCWGKETCVQHISSPSFTAFLPSYGLPAARSLITCKEWGKNRWSSVRVGCSGNLPQDTCAVALWTHPTIKELTLALIPSPAILLEGRGSRRHSSWFLGLSAALGREPAFLPFRLFLLPPSPLIYQDLFSTVRWDSTINLWDVPNFKTRCQ